MPSLWRAVKLRMNLLWYKLCCFSDVNYFVIILNRYWSLSWQGHLRSHFKSKAWQLSTKLYWKWSIANVSMPSCGSTLRGMGWTKGVPTNVLEGTVSRVSCLDNHVEEQPCLEAESEICQRSMAAHTIIMSFCECRKSCWHMIILTNNC